jgi:hypothetical protein
MTLTEILNGFVANPTAETETILCVADVAGSLAGTSWKFTVTDEENADVVHQVYYTVDGVGANPVLGVAELDVITNRADAAGDLAAKYFLIYDGPSTAVVAYYCYFTLADTAGYQELGLAGLTAGADTGLSQETDYAVKVAVDARDVEEFTITTPAATVTVTILLALLNAATLRATWSLVGGDIRCTSKRLGVGSAIAITAGTSSDLLAALTSTPDTAIAYKTAYDPKLGQREVAKITCPADTAGSLDGTYWLLYSGTTKYKVWYAVIGDTNTEPVVADSTAICVMIPSGATAAMVAKATAEAINAERTSTFLCELFSGANILITVAALGATTDAADGDTGITAAVAQAGVAVVAGLATKTLLCSVTVTVGMADEAVAAAMVTALTAAGWTAAAQAPANDHKVNVTHPTIGNTTNTADGNVGGAFAVAITAGVDPTPDIIPVAVEIDADAAATTVATATLTALNAHAVQMRKLFPVTLSTATLTLRNKHKGVVADAADVDAGVTPTTTVQGAATEVVNMGQNVATANYLYLPPVGKMAHLRHLLLSLSDTAVTAGGSFGALAALTNGFNINVCSYDGTVLKRLAGPIKTNSQFVDMGQAAILGTTMLQVAIDLVQMCGSEIVVNGALGEYLEVDVDDNLNGIDGFYMQVSGFLSDVLS